MLKNRTLKILALLAAAVVLSVSGQGHVSAANTAHKKCADKLGVKASSKSDRMTGCAYGYNLAIQGKKKTGCNSRFKSSGKAKTACRDVGYPLGQANKSSGGGGGGSSSSPTPTGAGQNCNEKHCDLIALYVNPIIDILSIIVALVVAASLVMGGVQYASSTGDPQKVGAAKTRITNTLLAFVAYAFMYAFLNFLIPGGLF